MFAVRFDNRSAVRFETTGETISETPSAEMLGGEEETDGAIEETAGNYAGDVNEQNDSMIFEMESDGEELDAESAEPFWIEDGLLLLF